tara:strand:- start:2160 stop:3041 length:882 start_codon:yes stop_codon:yes gene_type:complete
MTETTTNETPNIRLATLIKELGSTDTAIAKAIALVTGKSISKTSVATHMPDGGNKQIKDEFFETIADALPFLNIIWLRFGKGKMLRDWSTKQQNDYVLESEWYKNRPKKSELYDEKKYSNLKPEYREIIKETARWDSQAKVKKELKATSFKDTLKAMFRSTYSSGTLRVDVDKDLCNRFRSIRTDTDPDPKLSQQQFADKLGVMRAMITSIESWRQNPSHHLMIRMWEQLSTPNKELNFKWLHTGEGPMFLSSSGESDESLRLRLKEVEEDRDMYKRMVKDYQAGEQFRGFSH